MRQYVVQPGDSPASIAAKLGGCPRCARDLVAVNTHKAAKRLPNGFITFHDLHAGETLNLPDIWDGDNDKRPPSYFKSLPSADGVTFGTGMACKPRPRMKTVANAGDGSPNEWDDGTLSAPGQTDSGLSFGSVFVVGLLIASAVGGVIELRRRS